jgi:putative hydrolase of the HAD superfamily
MIKALLFDLDDTLYPEKDFLVSGYTAVARHAAERYGCDHDDMLSTMTGALAVSGRHSVFPALLARFPAVSCSLDELVEQYRCHRPDIHLYSGYRSLLERLAEDYRLGVITDGLPSVQRRKATVLGLDAVIEKMICSWDFGTEREKPHPHSFLMMMDALGADPASSLFVGDNPEKDGKGALGVGMKFVCLRKENRSGDVAASILRGMPISVIDTLFQLPEILLRIGRNGD